MAQITWQTSARDAQAGIPEGCTVTGRLAWCSLLTLSGVAGRAACRRWPQEPVSGYRRGDRGGHASRPVGAVRFASLLGEYDRPFPEILPALFFYLGVLVQTLSDIVALSDIGKYTSQTVRIIAQ